MKLPVRYNPLAIGLHWLVALLIVLNVMLALYMTSLPRGLLKGQMIDRHKSIGLTILFLVFLRLMWRFTNPVPMLPKAMPQWQKSAAHASHTLLYVLMFAVPLLGWSMSDAGGHHPTWFGLPVPVIPLPAHAFGHWLAFAHVWGAWTLLALATAHMGAALYHHFIRGDTVLTRMLPRCNCK